MLLLLGVGLANYSLFSGYDKGELEILWKFFVEEFRDLTKKSRETPRESRFP